MATPVWIWLPGETEPTQAATLTAAPRDGRWIYDEAYLAHPSRLAPDPVRLRLSLRTKAALQSKEDGLPGVVRDAKPSGYGADRLVAQVGRELSSLELLEMGVPDSVGALEACQDLEGKLAWVPHHYEQLKDAVASLDEGAPASRAVRQLNNDGSTSAGGERPKLTIQDDGRLWLAKLQDRSDTPFLPAKEYTVMRLAAECGIRVPEVRLEQVGTHQVFLIERFDRAGNPLKPERRLFASAHTVLNLELDAAKGDPSRSYLALADEMRVWCKGSPLLESHLQELWRRMAFNALVGNADDHPRNHGLLHRDGFWGLSEAFDITPVSMSQAPLVLSMATGADGGSQADAQRLIASSSHFELAPEQAAEWLTLASEKVTHEWRERMRGNGVSESAVLGVAPAFRLSEQVVADPAAIACALESAGKRPRRARVVHVR